MQPGLFFFLLYHTNKAVKDFNVLLTLAVYDGAFSDFDVVNQFLNNFPVKLLHIQIAADDTGPLPDIFNLLLGFPLPSSWRRWLTSWQANTGTSIARTCSISLTIPF